MQALFLALFIRGAGAVTLHSLAERLAVPSGERTPINLAQVSEVMRADSAALPQVQAQPSVTDIFQTAKAEFDEKMDDAVNGYFESEEGKKYMAKNKAIADIQAQGRAEWQASMPKPADTPPTHFDSEQDKKIWQAEQGNRILQGDPVGDLRNALDGLQKMNDRAQAKIIKKFSFVEKPTKKDLEKKVNSKDEPTKEEKDKNAEAMTESVVEPKKAREGEDKTVEDAGGWDITFYVLLTACVFVFGWWAIKLGYHERAAEAAKEFAFQCKKFLSTTLKGGDNHSKMQDEKSESSYEASEGTDPSSASSKGALNSHLQGVIEKVKSSVGDQQKK